MSVPNNWGQASDRHATPAGHFGGLNPTPRVRFCRETQRNGGNLVIGVEALGVRKQACAVVP